MKNLLVAMVAVMMLAQPAFAHGRIGRAIWFATLPINAPCRLVVGLIDSKFLILKDDSQSFKEQILWWWYINTTLDGSGE